METLPTTTNLARNNDWKGDSVGSDCAAPVFLRKTYHMIDTSNPEIASWDDNGTTFVVKDADLFASEVIPQYFNHSNWSSFVRQLNFYGFRKIKAAPLRVEEAKKSCTTKYWKFRHPLFQQDRKDLLIRIKKNDKNAASDRLEIEQLKSDVSGIKTELSSVTSQLSKLTTMFEAVLRQQASAGMKRKADDLEPIPVPVTSATAPPTERREIIGSTDFAPLSRTDNVFSSTATQGSTNTIGSMDMDVLNSLMQLDGQQKRASLSRPATKKARQESLMSIGSLNPEVLSSLFELDAAMDAQDNAAASASQVTGTVTPPIDESVETVGL